MHYHGGIHLFQQSLPRLTFGFDSHLSFYGSQYSYLSGVWTILRWRMTVAQTSFAMASARFEYFAKALPRPKLSWL